MKAIAAKLLFDGERLHRDKVLVFEGEKIVGVEDRFDGDVEEVAVITPGFIDAHAHFGIDESGKGIKGDDTNEWSKEQTASCRVIDGINPDEQGLKEALIYGIHATAVFPGSANSIGGVGGMFFTGGARVVEDMIVKFPMGVKFAFGENPKSTGLETKRTPFTRMGVADIIRRKFAELENWLTDEKRKRDLDMEVLKMLRERRVKARMHAHRADDIATAVRLAYECGFDLVIEHGVESWKIADFLAESGVPVVFGPYSSRVKVELEAKRPDTPVFLKRAGVRFALMSDYPVEPADGLLIIMDVVEREGLGRWDVVKAVTSDAAWICDVADQLGRLDKGYWACFNVFEKEDFSFIKGPSRIFFKGKEIDITKAKSYIWDRPFSVAEL